MVATRSNFARARTVFSTGEGCLRGDRRHGREGSGCLRVDVAAVSLRPSAGGECPGHAPGTQSDAVGAGYNLLLQPFSVGVHRLIIRASVPDFGIAVDTEFIINVEPR